MTRPGRRTDGGEDDLVDSPPGRPSRPGDGRPARPPRAGRPERGDRPDRGDRPVRDSTATAVRERPPAGARPGPRPGAASSRERALRPSPQPGVLRSWRLWAIPLLVVLTVLAVVEAVSPNGGLRPASTLLGKPAGSPLVSEAPAGAGQNIDIPTAELPTGGAFPVSGTGTWHVVPGTTPQVGTGRVWTYTVEVEDGASVPEGDQAFATAVDATLSDPRSWVGSGQIAVRRIDNGVPDFRVSLTSQLTDRSQCGYDIRYEASCYKPDIRRVLINGARWVRGAAAFDGQLGLYRQYAINHEVGHAFGNGHVPCPANGALAPVMMQQSFGVSNDYLAQLTEENPQGTQIPRDGKTCQPNAWPYPQGALPAG